ncbi:hypothetical protein [Paracoccus yeei]|uniref:hypothetical protein n=1 Tax=Paracoccus yeei TaxID=147645 RepID=UPI001F246618|nr:hypothetical protein [Paracoccus yeei]
MAEKQQPDRGSAHDQRRQFQQGCDIIALDEATRCPGADEAGAAEQNQQRRKRGHVHAGHLFQERAQIGEHAEGRAPGQHAGDQPAPEIRPLQQVEQCPDILR